MYHNYITILIYIYDINNIIILNMNGSYIKKYKIHEKNENTKKGKR